MSKINNLKFDIVGSIEEGKKIWQKLSPNENIYDNWGLRHCFYKYFNYPLRFYTGYDGGELIGLLPLQYNNELKRLEFFGGSFMEDNRVFIKPGYEECVPQFYNNIKDPARFEDIIGEDPFTKSLDILEYKYVADISKTKNANDYLVKKFRAKSRNGLRKKIKSIEKMNPEIVVNNYSDIDALMDLNKKAFGKESSFCKPFRYEIYHDLFNLNLDIHTLSFVINGKKEAISLAIKYKNSYVYINAGTNKKGVPNLGTYVIFKNIEKAIQVGAKFFDAGLEDLGWKERWHLDKIPQRVFISK